MNHDVNQAGPGLPRSLPYTFSMMSEAEDRLRIVIDTNVLVAALTNWSGAAARIVDAVVEGRLEVVSSEATLR